MIEKNKKSKVKILKMKEFILSWTFNFLLSNRRQYVFGKMER